MSLKPEPSEADSASATGSMNPLSAALDVERSGSSYKLFTIELIQGDGQTFSMRVHDAMSVAEVHKKISTALGPARCPMYAIRLIYKAKVLSHDPSATLGSFSVSEGEQLRLVVVRDGAAQRLNGGGGDTGCSNSIAKKRPGRRRLSSISTFTRSGTGSLPVAIVPEQSLPATTA